MDELILNMDDLTCHLGHLPRRHPTAFPVQNVGYALKTHDSFLRKRRFTSVNFSFLLEGEGRYQVDEEPGIDVRAPRVLTQAPGHAYTYGPGEGQTWKELFCIYPESTLSAWQDLRFYDPDCKSWSVSNKAALESRVASLLHALEQRESDGMADVIDRLSELLVLESQHRAPPRNLSPVHTRLYALRQRIDLHPEQAYDFLQLARKCGCSYSTFRRDWKLLFGQSPGRYLAERRMQEACRMLVESDVTISEIASRLGFEDAMYFSRCFHQHAGRTASEYRRINQSAHGR